MREKLWWWGNVGHLNILTGRQVDIQCFYGRLECGGLISG